MDKYIDVCLDEARISYQQSDVPIGAIIVKNGEIIAKSHNTREMDKSILGHAEINAILSASKLLNRWNLSDCELYVTLKPCSMCMEVIKQSRIGKIYYLLEKLDYKKEFTKSEFIKINEKESEQMYRKMLSGFFKDKR